jgi:zinc protease
LPITIKPLLPVQPRHGMARAMRLRLFAFLSLLPALTACAPQIERVASAAAPREKAPWAFAESDVPVDPGFKFGILANGMRYAVRQNATPKGTAMVRMVVEAGALDEEESERGFAHYVEHMAFNGSARVPEGEMVRLLERSGLAFGADTNASTGFDQTSYRLDLPRADPKLLDTALMLMRETASALTFDPEAVNRERGVVLAELRDRNSFALRNTEDQLGFLHPGARYPRRLPIGTIETLNAATAETLRAFWQREYVPKHTIVVVVGDFDAAAAEAAILSHFADWQPAPAEPQPDAGPVKPADKGRTDVYVDPALSERVTASRHGRYIDERDTIAQRQENLLRQIGYAIVNRRLLSATRQADPPFRGAGFGTGSVFEAGRTTNLVVDTVDGKWRRGLISAAEEYRRAFAFGFTEAEVAEQVAAIRTASENAAASAATRTNAALVGAVMALINDRVVPSTPQSALERLLAFIPQITPASVLAALKREAVPLDDPLLRFQGRTPPSGGATAIRSAWNTAQRTRLAKPKGTDAAQFAYTDFGPPGTVVSDVREPQLGIRQVRFANNVRLNLKHTDLADDRVSVQLSVDGGDRLNTRDNPLATEMVAMLPAGGLGRHSQDELQSLLAGRTVGSGIASTPETFVTTATTTPRDLELQLQLLAAYLTDPGYREEGEVRYRLSINNFFAQLDATPSSALNAKLGNILADNDPRYSLLAPEAYRKLTFDRLKADIADRLQRGAIEIGIVGDIDEDQAIALVAKTFGALPEREPDFREYPEQRQRPFTADRTPRTITHKGPADQAIIRWTWPTVDDEDPALKQQFDVLERVMRGALVDNLREKLGKAYSPGAQSALSSSWDEYGTFAITASVDVADLDATRAAVAETLAELRAQRVGEDTLHRARQPLAEALDNMLKSNSGWLSLVDRAQTEPDRIDRYLKARTRLDSVSAAEIQALARRYLDPKDAVVITVLPEVVAGQRPANQGSTP